VLGKHKENPLMGVALKITKQTGEVSIAKIFTN